MLDSLRALRGLHGFNSLPSSHRRIVFYAEDRGSSWPHFEPILRELTGPLGRQVSYVTSSLADPVLEGGIANISPFYIGSGALRTYFFLTLKAGVMVMTMPDLQTLYIKRSKSHAVHYAYVFHALVSTHAVYRKDAFDHYDSLLCAGPHHVREIRAAEEQYGLQSKALYEHGYGRLDTLVGEFEAGTRSDDSGADGNGDKPLALLAPTWGEQAIFETCGHEVIRTLLDGGVRVMMRPHPMTLRHRGTVLEELRTTFSGHPDFESEADPASTESLHAADVIISDWSGAALEFALAFSKPVVYIDVPQKVNNPGYQELGVEPVERSMRELLGRVLSPDRLQELPKVIRELTSNAPSATERIADAREQMVFNLGGSGRVGAAIIAELADSCLS